MSQKLGFDLKMLLSPIYTSSLISLDFYFGLGNIYDFRKVVFRVHVKNLQNLELRADSIAQS